MIFLIDLAILLTVLSIWWKYVIKNDTNKDKKDGELK